MSRVDKKGLKFEGEQNNMTSETVVVLPRRRRRQPQIRPLEFYVISAQELRRVRSSMRTYVVCSVSTSDTRVKTHTDYEGGLSPSWNEKMCIQIEETLLQPDSNSQLTFEIYCHGHGFGFLNRDKLVGTVRISLVDAVKAGANPYPITTYLIFTPDGDSQGLLNVCVPPNGRFPKRLDSLSFKRNQGMQLEAVPSFKQGEVDEDEGQAEEVFEDAVNDIAGESSSSAAKNSLAGIDQEDQELGIYDDSFFDAAHAPARKP